MAMIEVKGLSKRFGPLLAVDKISFSVERGEVLGFLGPNGAGKSTTMKMICGFVEPSEGTASVCGHDIQDAPIKAKRCFGYLPEGAPAYPDMTPRGFLEFIAGIRGLSGARRRERLEAVIEAVHIGRVLEQPIDTLSKGFKRRVGLAQTLLHDPEVLVMDEPTDGLDPNQKHEVRELIRTMAKDKAILLSTHILEEVEAVCTRAIIIASGRIVADGTPRDLEARARHHNAVVIRVGADRADQIEHSIGSVIHLAAIERRDEGVNQVALVCFPKDGHAIMEDIADNLRRRELRVDEMYVLPGRLDEVFRSVTQGSRS
jgi:ABC-2 type transport system ATP-binding protein